MAKVVTPSFVISSSTDQTSNDVALRMPKFASTFAKTEDVAGSCTLARKAAPVDADCVYQIKAKHVDKVNLSLIKNMYPAAVSDGVQMSVRMEAVISITDSVDATYREDVPVVIQTNFIAGLNGNVSSSQLELALKAAIGAWYYTDGSTRIADLIRTATEPGKD